MSAILKDWTDEEIEDWLDSIYQPIEFAGMTIHASDMKHIDPIMFRCCRADMEDVWICSECDEEYKDEDEANECCITDEG
jgi:hypothetical protein